MTIQTKGAELQITTGLSRTWTSLCLSKKDTIERADFINDVALSLQEKEIEGVIGVLDINKFPSQFTTKVTTLIFNLHRLPLHKEHSELI